MGGFLLSLEKEGEVEYSFACNPSRLAPILLDLALDAAKN